VTYETDNIVLEKIDGLWYPKEVRYRSTFKFPGGVSYQTSSFTVITDIEPLTTPPNDSVFVIDWPKDIRIVDRVLGIEYGQDLEHPLDQMYADLMADRAWLDTQKEKTIDSKSPAASPEPAFAERGTSTRTSGASNSSPNRRIYWVAACIPVLAGLAAIVYRLRHGRGTV